MTLNHKFNKIDKLNLNKVAAKFITVRCKVVLLFTNNLHFYQNFKVLDFEITL